MGLNCSFPEPVDSGQVRMANTRFRPCLAGRSSLDRWVGLGTPPGLTDHPTAMFSAASACAEGHRQCRPGSSFSRPCPEYLCIPEEQRSRDPAGSCPGLPEDPLLCRCESLCFSPLAAVGQRTNLTQVSAYLFLQNHDGFTEQLLCAGYLPRYRCGQVFCLCPQEPVFGRGSCLFTK